MSDTENPGTSGEDQPEATAPIDPPPAYPSPYGAPAASDAPAAYPPPAYQAPAYQAPAYPAPASPYGYQPAFTPPAEPERRPRVSGWTWPLVALLALVVGLAGGAIGGSLASDDDNGTTGDGSGGILKVQRRTAAPLPANNSSIASVAQELLPSTVQIIAEYKGEDQGATGSGFVFDKQGHVITNNHVVAEAAADKGPIDVIDQAGKHHKATVVGRSPVYDLAVLKIADFAGLRPAAIGSADQMHVGETVVAFGSPLALTATVTSGIISAVNRPVTTGNGDDASFINAIQTDAAINPGNSGGPLADLQGQVIGVNSALASLGSSDGEGANIGIGFAIPIEQVQVTADQILRTGKAQYPVIGVTVKGSSKIDGAEVTDINSGTPAASSALKVGDVITRVDDVPVSGLTDVIVAIRSHLVTDQVTLTVRRGGKTLTIKVGLVAKTG